MQIQEAIANKLI